jgi:hypothetical protein
MQQLPAKTSPKWLALTAQGIAAVVLFAMTASLLPGQEAGLRAHPHQARTRPRPRYGGAAGHAIGGHKWRASYLYRLPTGEGGAGVKKF